MKRSTGISKKEVKFGESEGGGQKVNCGNGGDGVSSNEDDDEECKDVKGNADKAVLDSFLGNIVEGYSYRDPENHQNNISRLNKEIVLRSKLETEHLSDVDCNVEFAREMSRGYDEEDGYVGEEVRFGESEGGGQKGNIGGGGDGGSGDKDDDK